MSLKVKHEHSISNENDIPQSLPFIQVVTVENVAARVHNRREIFDTVYGSKILSLLLCTLDSSDTSCSPNHLTRLCLEIRETM